MPKISLLPKTSAPTINDKIPIVSNGIADYVLASDLITLFNANASARLGLYFSSARGNTDNPGFGATHYMDTAGNTGSSSTEAFVGDVVPMAGTARNLYIDMQANSLNSGTSVFTLMKNGVATALTVSVAFGVVSITGDTTHTVAVSAGDRLTVRGVISGTSGVCSWAFAYMVN